MYAIRSYYDSGLRSASAEGAAMTDGAGGAWRTPGSASPWAAGEIGADAVALEKMVAQFNLHARAGEDPES